MISERIKVIKLSKSEDFEARFIAASSTHASDRTLFRLLRDGDETVKLGAASTLHGRLKELHRILDEYKDPEVAYMGTGEFNYPFYLEFRANRMANKLREAGMEREPIWDLA